MINRTFLKNNFVRVAKHSNCQQSISMSIREDLNIESLIVTKDVDCFILTIPSIDDFKVSKLSSRNKGSLSYVYISNLNIDNGVYSIDLAESNEDEVIIYLEDKF